MPFYLRPARIQGNDACVSIVNCQLDEPQHGRQYIRYFERFCKENAGNFPPAGAHETGGLKVHIGAAVGVQRLSGHVFRAGPDNEPDQIRHVLWLA